MAGFSQIVRVDSLRTVAFGSITTGFLPIGTPLTHTNRIIKFTNTSDADLIISYDGTTSNDVVTAGGFVLYDFTSNAISNNGFVTSIGTQLFVKYVAAPTKGALYVTCIYGQGE